MASRLETNGWKIDQTLERLICTNEKENIKITYGFVPKGRFSIESPSSPFINFTTDSESSFRALNEHLLQHEIKVSIPQEIKTCLQNLPKLVVTEQQNSVPKFKPDEIKYPELVSHVRDAFVSDNLELVQYIFSQRNNFSADVQKQFWEVVSANLTYCFNDNRRHDPKIPTAVNCFEYVLSQCHAHFNLNREKEGTAFDKFHTSKIHCLNFIAKTIEGELAIRLSTPLLEAPSGMNNGTLGGRPQALQSAMQQNNLKLFDHLLKKLPYQTYIKISDDGKKTCTEATKNFRFEYLDLLLQHGASVQSSGDWLTTATDEANKLTDKVKQEQAFRVIETIRLSSPTVTEKQPSALQQYPGTQFGTPQQANSEKAGNDGIKKGMS